jgi:hypothetical protein
MSPALAKGVAKAGQEIQERKAEKVRAREEHEPEMDSGLIWVNCPSKEAITLVGEALGKRARVYVGERPPEGEKPSSVVFCAKGEGAVAEGVRRLRALDPEVPVLLFGLRVDPKIARTALLAGAHGFIHRGMQPAQVARALSAASAGETIVPRELLEALLVERAQRAELGTFTSRQREILEQLVVAATCRGEIAIPRELLEAFLVEVVAV